MVCYQIILILLSLMILIYLHVQLYTCTCKCTCVHEIWEILLSIDVFINLYQKIQLVLKPHPLSVIQASTQILWTCIHFIRALNGWALFVGIFFLNVRNCSYNPVWRSHPNGEELLGCVWSRKPFLSFQYVG